MCLFIAGLAPKGLLSARAKIKYDFTEEGKLVLKSCESVIDRYGELRKELDELESKLKEKEKQMKYLLVHRGGEG